MLVSFYVNGKLSSFGEGNWENNIPQIGAEFDVHINKDGKMCSYSDSTAKRHVLIVDRVVYDPYVKNEEHVEIPYNFCDVKVYLIDKPKPIEIK